MTQQHLSAPESAQINVAEPVYGATADRIRDQLREPSDLGTAVRVAQRMLAHYGTVDSGNIYAYAVAHGGLTEALRLVLRALGAEAVDAR